MASWQQWHCKECGIWNLHCETVHPPGSPKVTRLPKHEVCMSTCCRTLCGIWYDASMHPMAACVNGACSAVNRREFRGGFDWPKDVLCRQPPLYIGPLQERATSLYSGRRMKQASPRCFCKACLSESIQSCLIDPPLSMYVRCHWCHGSCVTQIT